MPLKRSIEERFWEKVDKTPGHGPNGDCWIWKSNIDRYGYGQFWVNEKKRAEVVHRQVWKMLKGEIPEKMLVCHSCDYRRCVNPDHLFLGTNKDNMYDMFDKGRGTIQRKLTEPQVIELIRRYRAGEKSSVLAQEYGVTIDHVSRLHRGERWSHVQALV